MNARAVVIIPTWDRKELVAECLDSLRGQTWRDFDILVVDDGSSDGTAAAIGRDYPEARVVRLLFNRGFCRAVNVGLRETGHELVVLLNNDMTLDPQFLERLIEAADRTDAALFAPLVLWRDSPDIIYSAGDRMCTNGRPESIGFRRPLEGFDFTREPFGVSAGAALYRRAVFERVGLFDESFVAYFEDADLSFRARLAGFRAEFVREAVAYHRGSASIEGRTWWRARQCMRNHALLTLKNMPLPLLARHTPAILAERFHQARRVVSSARAEAGLAWALWVLAGTWLSTAARVPAALSERWRIRQRTRVLANAALEALLSRKAPES